MRIMPHTIQVYEYKYTDYDHAYTFIEAYIQICMYVYMYMHTFLLSVSYKVHVLFMQKYNCHSKRESNGFSDIMNCYYCPFLHLTI